MEEVHLSQFMGFPESLAQTANTSGKQPVQIKFRNYHKYVSKDTLEVLGQSEENEA